ncbi:MAG: ATP-dependent DNA helicase UvrD/PcrA [uncultured Solirubrobacteraceae bacterium]|uniref:DNA 3'-5' helicase n=1 Tax=uncultured Solirubrobacteraceae bacterium TaxID=1162706 RepID=A0A6J4S005_9ACTN|nr:MAG: ATP-dependent DNA helicase UvrD/PcrA [uncultured Solirubrobacteraceae bacterium]
MPDLTPAQARAVAHPNGPLLVLGGAGSGKTTVLARRFAWLVAHEQAAPESILALTPTAGGAAGLRRAVEDALDGPYEELVIHGVRDFCARLLREETREAGVDPFFAPVSRADRLALLLDRIDDLHLRSHDIGGRPAVLLADVIDRIDRLKDALVTAADYAAWAASLPDAGDAERTRAAREAEFAQLYVDHDRLLGAAGALDAGELVLRAVALLRERPHVRARVAERYRHVLVDGWADFGFAPALLVELLAAEHGRLTVCADDDGAVRRMRAAATKNIHDFVRGHPDAQIVRLERSLRCPQQVLDAAEAVLAPIADRIGTPLSASEGEMGPSPMSPEDAASGGGMGPNPMSPEGPDRPHPAPVPPEGPDRPHPAPVRFWRAADERAQAQAVAAEVERLVRGGCPPDRIGVVVRSLGDEGRHVTLALEERAIALRAVGEADFFAQAEVRDVLAWLRLLADPADAAAVVRALARPPVTLRSVDIARCVQIARRRKLDMVSALQAATESPQLPPEAREHIHTFLRLYRDVSGTLDSARPDLFVHRLVDRLELRRQQVFSAQADVVERLVNLARLGELASSYAQRAPHATPRDFARYAAAVAEAGLHEEDGAGAPPPAGAVALMALDAAGERDLDWVFVLGLTSARMPGARLRAGENVPDALLKETLGDDDRTTHTDAMRRLLNVAMTRAAKGLVLAYPALSAGGVAQPPSPFAEEARAALGAEWEVLEEELFGPEEALHATFQTLRDDLLADVARVGKGLGELRLDTDLDVTHAVARYLELVKLAALIERPAGQSVADALGPVNQRLAAELSPLQREVLATSSLDALLLDAERDDRARAAARAARSEPSLEVFLPRRGDGLMLSASDIETYRGCPLRYKFARVLRVPQEPTLNQRFGILVHQVLERYHQLAVESLDELLGLLDFGWRRGGFGDSDEERQLRAKAATALQRYYARVAEEPVEPVWFERAFAFKIGAHTLRGRVDRVDRLADGDYELIDYKTGRPRSAAALREDVQLSLYAVGAREAWQLDATRQAYLYLLDDEKVGVPSSEIDADWIADTVEEVAGGILAQDFEPTPSYAVCSMCDYRIACPAAER